MPVEDDLNLIRQLLTARSVPVVPETFENDDTAALFKDLADIRSALLLFSRGNFDADVTGRNVFAAALKALQANLRHLMWQVGEVAKGDFTQRVDFMGEFSLAFNSMTQQLDQSLTELKEREASLLALTADLKASEERWNLAVQCSRDGIWDVNIDERTAWYSENFMRMMRYTTKKLPKNLDWEEMIHPDDVDQAAVMLKTLRGTGELLPFSEECRFRTGQGEYLWLRLRGMPVHAGSTRRVIAIASDITAQKEAEQSLTRQAMYDNLTGLPNRYLLNDRLEQAVANTERYGKPFVLVTLDLDFFKGVNDTYGHAAGDQILVELAKRLSMGMRATDTAARLGGDEFIALYPCEADMEQTTTERVMSHFYENLKPPVMLGDVEYQLRSSAGVAFFPRHAKDVPTLFERADIALYKAKKNGKNQYAVYEIGDETPK
ncbi:MAG: diguanylate cyclase [Betaproteobacteria bacterium]|nr:diguanylate cyclase [Betaproteobacteria bacterium]